MSSPPRLHEKNTACAQLYESICMHLSDQNPFTCHLVWHHLPHELAYRNEYPHSVHPHRNSTVPHSHIRDQFLPCVRPDRRSGICGRLNITYSTLLKLFPFRIHHTSGNGATCTATLCLPCFCLFHSYSSRKTSPAEGRLISVRHNRVL